MAGATTHLAGNGAQANPALEVVNQNGNGIIIGRTINARLPDSDQRHAQAKFLGTTRNTGNRGDTCSNSASGASLSIGRCGLAPGARFK